MTRERRTEWLNKWLSTDNSKHCPSTVQAFDTSSTHLLAASKHWVRHARPFFPPDFEAAATRHDMARYGTIWHDMARYGTIWHDMARDKMLPEYAICSLSATCDLCYPLYESMSNCVCLKTWWTYQMPGDSMQGLVRCQPRLGVGRRRLSKPEHSRSFQLKVRSVFAHKSSKSSKCSSMFKCYMIYFYNLKASSGRYCSCHHVIAWEFEDTSRRGLMLVHLDSAVQHIEALQLSKLLKSDQVKLWKRVSKFSDCSKEFLISSMNWIEKWGFSMIFLPVYRSRCRSA